MAPLFPSYVITVLELFQKHGFEAYVVGGAVRDLLCGKHPHDYDIVTSARPEETRRLCKGAGLSVVENRGENFGVLVLLVEGRAVEVAAYRKETYGTDAHRPNGVAYCQTLEEDLARRDFTVNAMAMDLAGNLTDPYGGRHDLEHHVLRVVGSPSARFAEDALRMFRACRFVAQLGFVPEAGILPAIKAEALRVKGLSLFRVKTELHKLLMAPYAGRGMDLMVQSGLAGMPCRIKKEGNYESVPILPELLDLVGVPQNPRFHPFDVWGHIWHALNHSDGSLTLGWAILLHDVGKGREGVRGIRPDGMPSDHGHDKVGKVMAEGILRRLGESEDLVKRVAFLVGNHMHFGPSRFLPDAALWRWLRKEARSGTFRRTKDLQEAFRELGNLCLADMAATTASAESQALARHFANQLFRMAGAMPVHTADLAISGRDLIAAGIPQKVLKRLLPLLLSRVQDRSLSNTSEVLQRAAAIWWEKEKGKGHYPHTSA
ncbi:CCA tRNA nucleotidyltransferase [uncultured Acidaminococcus sp.]|jgi:tRNA nucleotidyltransferase/poly(A) polymerase|uniref:CCA tRNA nucleotidyltransferase n=1 Tax=uncultured Acidaminococcus sp. TaxID=352152 RepID=UPI0025E22C0E|nr:CCA tRNA nucleotidyltransferase [uncultured Acidaminococcus sp.]